jgi:hypothetical protein
MEQVLTDRDEHDRIGAAGMAQAKTFSWQEAARRTVDSYRRALAPEGAQTSV